MKPLAWTVGTLAALLYAAVFAGALMLGSTAHEGREYARARAEMAAWADSAEAAHERHMAADSARERTIERMLPTY